MFPFDRSNDESFQSMEHELNEEDKENNKMSGSIEISNRSKRISKQPQYLKDYHCFLAIKDKDFKKEKGILYPLSSILNYDRLSAWHKAFS